MRDIFFCITSFQFIFDQLDIELSETLIDNLKHHLKKSAITQGQWGTTWHEGIPSIFVNCEFEPVFILTDQFKSMMDDTFNVSKICIENANNVQKSNIIFRGIEAKFNENDHIADDIEKIFNIKIL